MSWFIVGGRHAGDLFFMPEQDKIARMAASYKYIPWRLALGVLSVFFLIYFQP